jgi:hypothetical protein
LRRGGGLLAQFRGHLIDRLVDRPRDGVVCHETSSMTRFDVSVSTKRNQDKDDLLSGQGA